MKAVAPAESCPRNHAKVSVPIGAQPAVSYYTVERPVETAGPLTVTSISVSCEEGDQTPFVILVKVPSPLFLNSVLASPVLRPTNKSTNPSLLKSPHAQP